MTDAPTNQELAAEIQQKYELILGDLTELEQEVRTLREENERLRQRLNEIDSVVNPDPTTDYDALTKEQKVRKVRTALLREAMTGTGRAAMQYDEVRALFNMNVSPGHAYNLMEAAGEMDGFGYDTSGGQNQGQKRVTCDADAVNDESLVHSVNKAVESNPA